MTQPRSFPPPPPSAPTSEPASTGTSDRLLTLGEVRDRLGISMRTLRRWRHDGRLVSIGIGGVIRVRESDLERALTGGTRSDLNPTESAA